LLNFRKKNKLPPLVYNKYLLSAALFGIFSLFLRSSFIIQPVIPDILAFVILNKTKYGSIVFQGDYRGDIWLSKAMAFVSPFSFIIRDKQEGQNKLEQLDST